VTAGLSAIETQVHRLEASRARPRRARYRRRAKWIVGLSAVLVLPFFGLAGIAIAYFASAHGDTGRILEGCSFAAGAAACAVVVVLAQRAGRNRLADEAIERRVQWDAQAGDTDFRPSADESHDDGPASPSR
jgi:hypothetical protein